MQVAQRDIWMAELPDPVGSTAGYQRPVVILQNDALNISLLATYIVVPLTGSTARKPVPWNLHLTARSTGLDRDSIAQTTLMLAVDQSRLIERIGRISQRQLEQLFQCLDIALGRR